MAPVDRSHTSSCFFLPLKLWPIALSFPRQSETLVEYLLIIHTLLHKNPPGGDSHEYLCAVFFTTEPDPCLIRWCKQILRLLAVTAPVRYIETQTEKRSQQRSVIHKAQNYFGRSERKRRLERAGVARRCSDRVFRTGPSMFVRRFVNSDQRDGT